MRPIKFSTYEKLVAGDKFAKDLLMDQLRKLFVAACEAASLDSREHVVGEANRIWEKAFRDWTEEFMGLKNAGEE